MRMLSFEIFELLPYGKSQVTNINEFDTEGNKIIISTV